MCLRPVALPLLRRPATRWFTFRETPLLSERHPPARPDRAGLGMT